MLAHLQAENSFLKAVIIFLLILAAIGITTAFAAIKLYTSERARQVIAPAVRSLRA